MTCSNRREEVDDGGAANDQPPHIGCYHGITWGMVATFLSVVSVGHPAELLVSVTPTADAFALVNAAGPAPVWFDANDHPVVAIAARDFADDVERVTGKRPALSTGEDSPVAGELVLVGTLGRSRLIDDLVRDGKLDASALAGKWETFLITTVAQPLPGVARALVIAGSDRRGTAFGVYELSQQIGVSPWYWWADVPPKKKTEIYIRAGVTTMGPPSVKYRGIFINDEDWGLQPWAAKTFAPEEGGIGPKVYRTVFELMLRLKANTLWPAMHACTKPFNAFPENARLADDYAIVMGSSHAEPMLRNNVGEWPHDRATDYNYVANRDGVLKYWEERVAANGRFENIYTVGMRGIHDSAIQGTKTDAERIRVLEQVFADQRALLTKHVRPEVEQVPQMFCAYKEVLDLYRQGLRVPEDVTIVWPDDNFGYVRNFATPEEQRTRTGGFGVYYHISYLGRPLAYLWLCTTPPALIWEEMSKAYEHGARQIWIVNVGDIKPAEIGTEFFLQMAWDINRWNRETLPHFLEEWAEREFGTEHAHEIADIMRHNYRLNYQRKPEHLQWWLPGEKPRPGPLSLDEILERTHRFDRLRTRCSSLDESVGHYPELAAALVQLVMYPVKAAAHANDRMLVGELASGRFASAEGAFEKLRPFAEDANRSLDSLTRYFNEQLSAGKWKHFMNLEPADDQWRSMRIERWRQPEFPAAERIDPLPSRWLPRKENATAPLEFEEREGVVAIEAAHFSRRVEHSGTGWRLVPGLGRTGQSSALFPTTTPSIDEAKLATGAPRLEYDTYFFTAGEHTLTAYLIPTHPIVAGRGLRFAVGLDDQVPQIVVVPREVGDAAWSQGVLNATVTGSAKITVSAAGKHVLKVYMVDAGVVLDKIVIDCGGLKPSYLGPPETRVEE